MEPRKLRIGITQGDPNGVGYEVIFKTFADPSMFELCTPVIYGSPKVATYHRKALNLPVNFNIVESAEKVKDGCLNIVNCYDEEIQITLGTPSAEAGKTAFECLERAVLEYKTGWIDAIVTAPIDKNTIQSDAFRFCGHTEYFASCFGDKAEPLMILMNDRLRVALVTTHLPIRKVADAITKEAIEKKLTLFDRSLRRDFYLDNPRIAVLSLNPHAGDHGLLGSEEEEVITPAIKEMFDKGVLCFGPYPADGFFGAGLYTHFDGVLAMYHDQGLAAFKALAMDDGVNFTAGLPLVRTSPDHGTAYDIAGKNLASEASMRHAIYTAMDVVKNRAQFDKDGANPLRRQTFDKPRGDKDKTNPTNNHKTAPQPNKEPKTADN